MLRIYNIINNFINLATIDKFEAFLLDIFYQKCLICKRGKAYWCNTCLKTEHRTIPRCALCPAISKHGKVCRNCIKAYNPPFSSVQSIVKYSDSTKLIMKEFKFNSVYRAARNLAEIIHSKILKTIERESIESIIPLPLHYSKRFYRGFNQNEKILRYIKEKKIKSLVKPKLLIQRYRSPQKSLKSQEERERYFLTETNTFNRFQAKPEIQEFKNILLIDDVITTGSTIYEASKAIKTANPKAKIHWVTVFRS